MGEFTSPEAIQILPKFALANLMRSRSGTKRRGPSRESFSKKKMKRFHKKQKLKNSKSHREWANLLRPKRFKFFLNLR
jgi:transposase